MIRLFLVLILLIQLFVAGTAAQTSGTKQDSGVSLLFFWTITKNEVNNVDQYATLFKCLETNTNIKLCLNVSPVVIEKWLTNSPDLIETMKRLKRSNRLEITVSLWHDIIPPLVYDLDLVRSKISNITDWPKEKFAYPADISEQVSRSWELSNRVFGDVSVGMVPAMGAVSSEVIDYLVSRCKFNIFWMLVSDNIVADIDYLPSLVYKIKSVNTYKKMYFLLRENRWSKYLEMPDILVSPDDITKKFVDYLKQKYNQDNLPLFVIGLTGETFWLSSGPQGKQLIEKLFIRLNSEKEISLILPEEYFENKPFVPEIKNFVPSTWSENGFAAWVGEQQENAAWELLAKTRKSLEEYKNSGQAQVKEINSAFEEIYSAEDGENFYYFGTDYDTESKEKEEKMERDFRNRLVEVYKQIDLSPPSGLLHPLEGLTFLGTISRPPGSENQSAETVITRTETGFIISDAIGDDNGPGDYVYPQGNFAAGAFDIQKFSCSLTDQEIRFTFTLSPSEKVTGFGLATIDLYIDLNNRLGAGITQLLPDRGAYTTPESAWEYCLNIKGKTAVLSQSATGNVIREIGTYPAQFLTGPRECVVHIPRTVLRGSPRNWGYLVIVCGLSPTEYQDNKIMDVKEMPDTQSFGGAMSGKIAPPIIDLIPSIGSSQRTLLNTYKSGRAVQLPAARLQ